MVDLIILLSGGESAVQYTPSPRKPDDTTAAQLEQCTIWLDAGIRSTKEAIAWVEQQFDLEYSERGMLKLLKRLDYRYTQPAQIPAKADPDAQAQWLKRYSAKRGH
jgi:transposase